MRDCKVRIKAAMKKVKDRFSEYEDMEFEERGEWVLAEDFSGTQLFGWEISDWVELAVCLRAYTQYDGEVDTDEGEDPEAAVSRWSDVADYMDEHMI